MKNLRLKVKKAAKIDRFGLGKRLGVLGSLLLLLLLRPGAMLAQTDLQEMMLLEHTARIKDGVVPSPFFHLPELRAKDGVLDVDLYVDFRKMNLGGTEVTLRGYTYRSGNDTSTQVGPWGPTLRLGPNDKLNLRIHNNLPEGQDRDYKGSIDLVNEKYLFDSDTIPHQLLAALANTSPAVRIYGKNVKGSKVHYAINSDDIELVSMVEEVAGSRWRIQGKNRCQCAKRGSCNKPDPNYLLLKMYNQGTQKEAIRFYEDLSAERVASNHAHGYNTTNMHTHGLHVSPFQDDIFRKVPPQLFSLYSYDLKGHTPGTFWYHPHVHGSTAIQVASGMSGPLIVEDQDLSEYPHLQAASSPAHERILLINQIDFNSVTLELESFEQAGNHRSPAGTTINGVAVPIMEIQPGEVQRWRIVQSGHDSKVAFGFPDEMEVYQIAVDGIYLKQPRRLHSLHLAPGNRSDILVRIPAGYKGKGLPIKSIQMNALCEYFPDSVICQAPFQGIQEGKEPDTIMWVDVKGNPLQMSFPSTLPKLGPELADIDKDSLEPYVRKTEFFIDTTTKPVQFEINGKAFSTDTIDEVIQLGTSEQWEISSGLSFHPYHIHVNPFQVVEYGGRAVTPPIWKDVVLVTPEEKATIYTRYTRYWGDFVLHCHILHHEDEGMMQRIRIQRPAIGKE